MDKPETPSEFTLWIYQFGEVVKLEFDYEMTSEDSAEYYVILHSITKQKKRIKINDLEQELFCYEFREFPDVQMKLMHNSIIQLTPHGLNKCIEWKKWCQKEAANFAMYKRLKKKFEGTERVFEEAMEGETNGNDDT